jgi:4-diphosphocytidyl-2-C-methyl-D-erythritol kinase
VKAHAKINLALVVGPLRDDGKHEVVTIYQPVELADDIELEQTDGALTVDGFPEDTLVRTALETLAAAAQVEPRWSVRLQKRIPVAAGLGGGSSDAAAALKLANATLSAPLPNEELHRIAATVGADVPFFLRDGPQLGSGDGTTLEPIALPQDYWIVLTLAHDAQKESSAAVYTAFDARNGAQGWEERRAALRTAMLNVRRPSDLAALPPNDLASSPLTHDLRDLGAFHADVSGAGPTAYGLFEHRNAAERAQRSLEGRARTWLTAPAWYV